MTPLAQLPATSRSLPWAGNLRAVVEVVPVVAGADPVVIGGGVVGLVVGVGRGVVELAGLGVLAGGLGVESSSGLTVEGREHLQEETGPSGAVQVGEEASPGKKCGQNKSRGRAPRGFPFEAHPRARRGDGLPPPAGCFGGAAQARGGFGAGGARTPRPRGAHSFLNSKGRPLKLAGPPPPPPPHASPRRASSAALRCCRCAPAAGACARPLPFVCVRSSPKTHLN
jgi:hypothetical protein